MKVLLHCCPPPKKKCKHFDIVHSFGLSLFKMYRRQPSWIFRGRPILGESSWGRSWLNSFPVLRGCPSRSYDWAPADNSSTLPTDLHWRRLKRNRKAMLLIQSNSWPWPVIRNFNVSFLAKVTSGRRSHMRALKQLRSMTSDTQSQATWLGRSWWNFYSHKRWSVFVFLPKTTES